MNSVRERMGLHALAWDAQTSEGCRRHGEYLARNPSEFAGNPHRENPSLPGYSDEGNFAAGTSGLSATELEYRDDWTFGYTAPWHNMIVFDPWATDLHRGYARGYDCLGVSARGFDPPSDRVWVWPPSGSTTVQPEVEHFEAPYPPTRIAGLPDKALTGPSFYIYGDAAVQSARADCVGRDVSLTGPGGAVPLAVIDSSSRGPAGETPYLYGGIMVLARQPLQYEAQYSLKATFSAGRGQCPSASAEATFTTLPRANDFELTVLYVPQGSRLRAGVTGTDLKPVLWLVDPRGRRHEIEARPAKRDDYFSDGAFVAELSGRLAAVSGLWKACASSGGPGSGYSFQERCRRVRVRPSQEVEAARTRTKLTIWPNRWAEGARAKVTLLRYRRSGLTGTLTRRIRLRARGSSLALPPWARGPGLLVRVEIPRRRLRGEALPSASRTLEPVVR